MSRALRSRLLASFSAAALVLPLPSGHRSTEANTAIDPRDGRDVVVVARDERSGDPHVGLRTWRSRDGGGSFRGSMLVDRTLEGLAADASDPVAAYGGRGAPAPAFLALRWGTTSWETRIMLGSRTVVSNVYGPPIPSLGRIFGSRVWHDKPWAAIDPRDGRAYVAWTERSETNTGPVNKIAFARAERGKAFTAPHLLGAGDSPQPVVGPGSSVVLVWFRQANLHSRAQIVSARSLDRGRTWSRTHVVARGVLALGEAPFPTVVRTSAGFAACWQQFARPQHEEVACSRSADGLTWSRARVVGGRPAAEEIQPALASSGGRLWLAFYRCERRSTSVELWKSRPSSQTWTRAAVLMRRPVPRSGFSFLGDYQGLAASRSSVIAAFAMPVRARAFRQVVEVARYPTR